MLDAMLKADKYLATDTRAMGRARGVLHGKDRYAGTSRASFEELKKTATDNYRESIPDVRQAVSALGGDWQVEGAIATYDRIYDGFYQEYEKQGLSDAEAKYRANRRAIAKLESLSNDKESSFIDITSSANDATIRVYAADKGSNGRFGSTLDDADAKSIARGISEARKYRFNKDPLIVNVLDRDSKVGPKAVHDELGDGDVAFTYIGGNGVYLYPDKVENVTSSDTWFSTSTDTRNETIKHLIVHETGHLQMYKLWGEDSSGRGSRQALEKDFAKFNVQKDGTSDYGNESISESFAEQYAKYLLTGDASPEFLELLASKGLAKAQINKKWRDQSTPFFAKDKFHGSFFKFMDTLFQDIENGGPREYVGQEASNYHNDDLHGGTSRYGTRNVNLVARIMGFRGNKPTTVSTLPNDSKIVYRGVNGSGGKSGWELHNEFRTSDTPWYGFGYYGNGQYSSTLQHEAAGYGVDVAKMRVKDDAKIYIDRSVSEFGFDKDTQNEGLNLSELHQKLFEPKGILQQLVVNEIDPDLDLDNPADYAQIDREARKLSKSMGLQGLYKLDRTILAAMLGFQGVEVAGNYTSSYALILDRSMMEMLVPPGFKD